MARRKLLFCSILLGSLLSASCAGSLFKVKPAAELPPMPSASRSVDAGGLSVRVAPLLNDEEAQQLFEANLHVAGVLPVRVELNLASGGPLELKKARFKVRDNQNREWKMLTSKQAVSRIMSANGIRLYNPNGKKQFESDMAAYGMDVKTPLDSSSPLRRGFLFFQTPDKRPVENGPLTLVIEKLPQPLSIPLQ
jgi:hypothetical protein